MADVVWVPPPERIERANLTRLARRLGCEGYADLHRLSVEEPERFWPAAIDDMGIEFSERWRSVEDTSDGPEWARWFVGGRVNVARVCVHRWADERPDDEAAVFLGEDGDRRSLSYAEMSDRVARLAEGLASLGIGEGDAVGI